MNHKKATVYLMLSILLAGSVLLFLKTFSLGSSPEISRESSMEKAIQAVDQMDTGAIGLLKLQDNPLDNLGEFYELIRLEAKTRRILQKDTLARKDSIFLDEVNKKLNRILYEKD